MAAFAPMPSASERTVTRVTNGVRRSVRSASRGFTIGRTSGQGDATGNSGSTVTAIRQFRGGAIGRMVPPNTDDAGMADQSRSKQFFGGVTRSVRSHMQHMLRLSGLFTAVLIIGVVAQSPTFKGGLFKASDGTTQIGLEFDSVGNINVYVD